MRYRSSAWRRVWASTRPVWAASGEAAKSTRSATRTAAVRTAMAPPGNQKKGGPPKWPPILQRTWKVRLYVDAGLELVPETDANADRDLVQPSGGGQHTAAP